MAEGLDLGGSGHESGIGEPDEQSVLNDSGDRSQSRSEPLRIRNRAKGAVEDEMDAVGNERLLAAAQTDLTSETEIGERFFDMRLVAARPKGTTSTGRGNAPSTGTALLESAMTTILREAEATIFSRRRAPPPPLMSRSFGSISSAPSTVRSSSGISSSVVTAMPRFFACASVRSEVVTQRILSPAATLSPTQSTKCLAVDPVPSPSRIPGSRSSAARLAAAIFS